LLAQLGVCDLQDQVVEGGQSALLRQVSIKRLALGDSGSPRTGWRTGDGRVSAALWAQVRKSTERACSWGRGAPCDGRPRSVRGLLWWPPVAAGVGLIQQPLCFFHKPQTSLPRGLARPACLGEGIEQLCFGGLRRLGRGLRGVGSLLWLHGIMI
jgi:hypothetical protein